MERGTEHAHQVARVEEGQEFEGWTVEAIHPNKVVMRRGQEVSEVVLEDKVRKPPPRLRRRDRTRVTPKQPPENEDGSTEKAEGSEEKKDNGMEEKKRE